MHVLIVESSLLATVQDEGRFGFRQLGIGPSGPLDRTLYRTTVQSVSDTNYQTRNAIELAHGAISFRAEESVQCSLDGSSPFVVPQGSLFNTGTISRAVRYLAFRGSIQVPLHMGSQATHVAGVFGGFQGRSLRKGDGLSLEPAPWIVAPTSTIFSNSWRIGGVLQVVPSQESEEEFLLCKKLTEHPFYVSRASNRTGYRLESVPGGVLNVPTVLSRRMSRGILPGTVQVPPDGRPIVIGPDGPTTGGYAVAGVLTQDSMERLFRCRFGTEVCFSATFDRMRL